jgi:hypothetical protein
VTDNAEAKACQANVRIVYGMLNSLCASANIALEDINIDTSGVFSTTVPGVTITLVGSSSNNFMKAWPQCQGHYYSVVNGNVENTCTHLTP